MVPLLVLALAIYLGLFVVGCIVALLGGRLNNDIMRVIRYIFAISSHFELV
jgi:ABC-type dipeptide/oligopeptide/nickel transport system permease subunit